MWHKSPLGHKSDMKMTGDRGLKVTSLKVIYQDRTGYEGPFPVSALTPVGGTLEGVVAGFETV